MIERIGQSLFLPTVLFGFAFFAAGQEHRLPADARLLLGYLPYVSLLLVAVIASAFNRGRSLMAASFGLLVLLADQYSELALLPALMLAVIPFNVALLAWLPERGALTAGGMTRIILLVGQILGLFYLADSYEAVLKAWLEWPLLSTWPEIFSHSQTAALIALVALLISFAASHFKAAPINQSLFGANVGFVAVLFLTLPAATEDAFLFTVALMLAIGLLRDYYNMAYRDELTGLPQRRALNESMTSLGGRYCIAMLDVDHFKKFNDTHGHDVGDQVLQLVASQIRKVQGGGKAYRYGGEEFTVVFNNKAVDDAVYFLDQVRKNIEDYEMVIRNQERKPNQEDDKGGKKSRKRGSYRNAEKKVSVTISIGVCERSRGEQPDQVLKKADEALYRAKKGGRNQVAT
ncbi:MAG: diguanylate cyclase [Pseudomonadales bacterium]